MNAELANKITTKNALSDDSIKILDVLNFVREAHNYLDNSGKHYVNHLVAVQHGISADIFEGNIDGFDLSSLNKELQIAALFHDFMEDINECIEKSGEEKLYLEFGSKIIEFEKVPGEDKVEYVSEKLRDMGIGEFAIQTIQRLSKPKLNKRQYKKLEKAYLEEHPKKSKPNKQELKDFRYIKDKELMGEELNKAVSKVEESGVNLESIFDLCKKIAVPSIKIADNKHNSLLDRFKAGSYVSKGKSEVLNPRIIKYNKSTEIMVSGLNSCFTRLDALNLKKFNIPKLARDFITKSSSLVESFSIASAFNNAQPNFSLNSIDR